MFLRSHFLGKRENSRIQPGLIQVLGERDLSSLPTARESGFRYFRGLIVFFDTGLCFTAKNQNDVDAGFDL